MDEKWLWVWQRGMMTAQNYWAYAGRIRPQFVDQVVRVLQNSGMKVAVTDSSEPPKEMP